MAVDDVNSAADLRPEVLAFAMIMERQLRANDHKTGWTGERPAWLLARLREETDELVREIESAGDRVWIDWDPDAHKTKPMAHRRLLVSYHPLIGWRCANPDEPRRFRPDEDAIERIGDEAADVANFAMMIADVAGALSNPPKKEGRS